MMITNITADILQKYVEANEVVFQFCGELVEVLTIPKRRIRKPSSDIYEEPIVLKSIQNKIDGQRMGGRNLLIGQLMMTCCSCLMALE